MSFLILARRMENNWLITNEHRLATILHPKLKNFESSSNEKENAISALKLAFDKHNSNIFSSSTHPVHSSHITSSSSSTTNTNTTTAKNNLLTQCFDSTINNNVKTSNPHQEIDDYLNCEYNYNYPDNSSEDGDIDILLYWREKQTIFPILASLAKQIHSIPASNTIVERLFSASKNTINEKRTSLACEKINQLIFLQKNFTLLKQLYNENRRKRTISISSTTTVSSEDSTCTMPKQSRIEDEISDLTSDDIELYFD
jgi:hypothetical protein